jgi:hypothetical protein
MYKKRGKAMNKIFVLFRNKLVVAVASSQSKIEELRDEFILAEGAIKNVNFRIAEVEDAEFIANL